MYMKFTRVCKNSFSSAGKSLLRMCKKIFLTVYEKNPRYNWCVRLAHLDDVVYFLVILLPGFKSSGNPNIFSAFLMLKNKCWIKLLDHLLLLYSFVCALLFHCYYSVLNEFHQHTLLWLMCIILCLNIFV